MKLSDIAKMLNAKVYAGENLLDTIIEDAYA